MAILNRLKAAFTRLVSGYRRLAPRAVASSPADLLYPVSSPMANNEVVGLSLMDIPEHLLTEIFLRLATIEDLARISAACTEFRRLVTDRSFLRCVLGVHTPQFLVLLEEGGFHPAQPPHPSTAAAHALTFKADFTFSFVPSPHRRPGYWFVQDIRDGRVLLRYAPWGNHRLESTDLAVCDPLHRRYIMLPAVPQELAALVAHQDMVNNPWCEPFLGVPLIVGEDVDVGTSFNVIWVAHYQTAWKTAVAAAFIFSSGTGKWKSVGEFTMVSLIQYTFSRRHYAYGCFFWELNKINKELLMLDTRSMEFSTVDLPPGEWTMNIAIVEAGEGSLGMFGIRDETGGDLCFYIRRNKGHSSAQWHMEKTISLASGYRHYIKAATERYLLLAKCGEPWCVPDEECISIDVNTFQLERFCVKPFEFAKNGAHIYTNFPPSLLSAPKI
uniref:F-box domain-containing protein n=2 Tax=Hordeum vulgare subsp. vulgare TaxID=112509 RepID=A0A8I6Z8Q4_HORVV